MEGHPLQPLVALIVHGGRVIAFSHSNIRYLVNQAPKDIPVGELDSSIASSRNYMQVQRALASLPMHWIVRLCQFLIYFMKRLNDKLEELMPLATT